MSLPALETSNRWHRAVVVTGGRDFTGGRMIEGALSTLRPNTLIHGAARGADITSAHIARRNGANIIPFHADWKPRDGYPVKRNKSGREFNPAGGLIRNEEMMAAVACLPVQSMCVAFPGGSGTADAMKRAEAHGLPVWRVADGLPPPEWRAPVYEPLEPREIDATTLGDGRRTYHTPLGGMPSVTTILSATMPHSKRQGLEAWRRRVGEEEAERVRVQAAERGTKVHSLIESFCGGSDPGQVDDGDIARYWQSILPELDRLMRQGKPIVLEQGLYHPEAWIAGTADAVFEIDGEVVIIDWKTKGRRVSDFDNDEHRLQLSAYAACLRRVYGLNVTRGMVITAVGDGGPAGRMLVPLEDLRDGWGRFMARRQSVT